jgi:hypothetical protein
VTASIACTCIRQSYPDPFPNPQPPIIQYIPQNPSPTPHSTPHSQRPFLIQQTLPSPSAVEYEDHLRNSLIAATPSMRLAVREKPVDDQAQHREEEDDNAPEQFVRGRAVGLEDFHCRSPRQLQSTKLCQVLIVRGKLTREERATMTSGQGERELAKCGEWGGGRGDVLNTRISRIKTMKPTTPPLVPYFQVLSTAVATISSAMAKEKRRRLKKSEEIIVAVSLLSRVMGNWYREVELWC